MQNERSQSGRQSRAHPAEAAPARRGNRGSRGGRRRPPPPSSPPSGKAPSVHPLDAWRNFVAFIDETYPEYTPRSEEKRDLRAVTAAVERKCIELLLLDPGVDWSALAERNFAESEARKIALDFFYYAKPRTSSAADPTPADYVVQFKLDLSEFVELVEATLASEEGRAPEHLQRFVKLLNRYRNGTASRSFLLLVALPDVLPEQVRPLLQRSPGYQAILQSGSFHPLRFFWRDLRRHFKLGAELDSDKNAAEPTVAELPVVAQPTVEPPVAEPPAALRFASPPVEEDPLELRRHLQTAQARIAELETMLAAGQQQAQTEAIQFFARALQNRSNPALDQLFTLYRWLQKERNSGVTLSSDLLRIFITLADVLESLDVMGITAFPSQLDAPFDLRSDQLGEYDYVDGSPFHHRADVKTVICVRPGWRVGATIITPARVKEVTKEE